MAEKSDRTKMIESAKVDQPFKEPVKAVAAGVSRAGDIATDLYNRAKQALTSDPKKNVEGYKRGGKVMAKKPAAKPAAKKPMPKGYACGGKVMKKASGRGR